MSDRGEKIITLAREMLRADDEIPANDREPAGVSMSFRMICLATVLTGFASSALTKWAEESNRVINRYERTELEALVFYTVQARGANERALRDEVYARFGVADFTAVQEKDFSRLRRYLQDKAQ